LHSTKKYSCSKTIHVLSLLAFYCNLCLAFRSFVLRFILLLQRMDSLVIGVIRVPQNVVVFTSPQENVRRLWTNAQFQFCIDNCEGKYWEHNCKAFKEANWKEFIKQLNVKFSDVQWSWKQV